MERQPQNLDFRINPENFHPWDYCTFLRVNNKGADQPVGMPRLVCPFVVYMQQSQVSSSLRAIS